VNPAYDGYEVHTISVRQENISVRAYLRACNASTNNSLRVLSNGAKYAKLSNFTTHHLPAREELRRWN
jgi:hypothetical protein